MMGFAFLRKSLRMAIFRRTSDPDAQLSTTKRKKFAASYSDIVNLHSAGTQELQGPDGKLIWMMDYDPLP